VQLTRLAAGAALGLLAAVSAGCGSPASGTPAQHVPGGDAGRGHDAIVRYGCGSCHAIPGVRDADAVVGPPLNEFGRRRTIAGKLPNTPANLVRWIRDPQAVDPGVDMPDLDVSARDARDIAEYLLAQR
jgi:cytochrome c1